MLSWIFSLFFLLKVTCCHLSTTHISTYNLHVIHLYHLNKNQVSKSYTVESLLVNKKLFWVAVISSLLDSYIGTTKTKKLKFSRFFNLCELNWIELPHAPVQPIFPCSFGARLIPKNLEPLQQNNLLKKKRRRDKKH